MKISEIFPSDKERNEAMRQLKTLLDCSGWKLLIEKFIDKEIEDVSNEILNTPFNEMKPERERYLKMKRANLLILKQIPETMIDVLTNWDESKDDFDPYFRDMAEIKAAEKKANAR